MRSRSASESMNPAKRTRSGSRAAGAIFLILHRHAVPALAKSRTPRSALPACLIHGRSGPNPLRIWWLLPRSSDSFFLRWGRLRWEPSDSRAFSVASCEHPVASMIHPGDGAVFYRKYRFKIDGGGLDPNFGRNMKNRQTHSVLLVVSIHTGFRGFSTPRSSHDSS